MYKIEGTTTWFTSIGRDGRSRANNRNRTSGTRTESWTTAAQTDRLETSPYYLSCDTPQVSSNFYIVAFNSFQKGGGSIMLKYERGRCFLSVRNRPIKGEPSSEVNHKLPRRWNNTIICKNQGNYSIKLIQLISLVIGRKIWTSNSKCNSIPFKC